MGIIEQAARRLEELRRAGVAPTLAAPVVSRAIEGGAGVVQTVAANEASAHSRLITLDLHKLADAGLITPLQPRSRLAEEYRSIKRPLLANWRSTAAASRARGNCIMVTSSLPGEGKTFTALNLALSIAMEVDLHVLLVDADVVRPAAIDRLGVPPSEGLLDVLEQTSKPLSDYLLRTNLDKLSLLPAGAPRPRSAELLTSGAMRRLVDDLSSRYSDRIIIFDAPPLLVSNEARVLASHMGQIVVVVDSERTRVSALQEAMQQVESCPQVMTLLNKSSGSANASGYGYYG